jgi:phage repressor protein C with HTH and peptisase S24 domain
MVWGDSMEPIYRAGDVLVIAPNSRVDVNDLVVFKNEKDEPYFKKYLGQTGGVHRFASFNPNYPVMEVKRGILKMHPVHSVIRALKGRIF